jgi:hypothetical protein
MGRMLKNKEFKSPGYGMVIPVGSTALRPQSPVNGTMRFNTDNSVLEAYFTSNSIQTWYSVAHVGSVDIQKDTFLGDGTTTVFTMTKGRYTYGQEAQVVCVVGNIFQNPGVAYTFQLGGGYNITFSTAPPLGQTIIVLHGFAGTNAA